MTARSEPLEVRLWLTPKVFDDLTDPVPGVEAFFEHFGLDFVDPWYWYRTHPDDRRTYLFQREKLVRLAGLIDGVSCFANDTFGQFVPREPLSETLTALRAADSRARGGAAMPRADPG
jgi:hypothetical protein